jgi:hypothetical protein
MRFSPKDGAVVLFLGAIGCAVFAYLALNDGDSFALWANAITAAYCLALGVRLWRR